MSPIRAVFFDLDGTLWDSEVVRFRSWVRVFEEHGARYTLESYATRLGTVGGVDPLDELEAAVGGPIDRAAVRRGRDERTTADLDRLSPRPGVTELIEQARRRGLATGVVSTDERAYVLSSLEHLGLGEGWDVVATADGDPTRAKPSPALYLEALAALSIDAEEAVAIEDSPNGILAATRARIFCVAVSHEVSATMDLSRSDLLVGSALDVSLDEVILLAERRAG